MSRIHHRVHVIGVVKKLKDPSFKADILNLLAGAPGLLKNFSLKNILELRPDEGSALAGIYVLKLKYRIVPAVDVETIPLLKSFVEANVNYLRRISLIMSIAEMYP